MQCRAYGSAIRGLWRDAGGVDELFGRVRVGSGVGVCGIPDIEAVPMVEGLSSRHGRAVGRRGGRSLHQRVAAFQRRKRAEPANTSVEWAVKRNTKAGRESIIFLTVIIIFAWHLHITPSFATARCIFYRRGMPAAHECARRPHTRDRPPFRGRQRPRYVIIREGSLTWRPVRRPGVGLLLS
jgi:hypothetical protein